MWPTACYSFECEIVATVEGALQASTVCTTVTPPRYAYLRSPSLYVSLMHAFSFTARVLALSPDFVRAPFSSFARRETASSVLGRGESRAPSERTRAHAIFVLSFVCILSLCIYVYLCKHV